MVGFFHGLLWLHTSGEIYLLLNEAFSPVMLSRGNVAVDFEDGPNAPYCPYETAVKTDQFVVGTVI